MINQSRINYDKLLDVFLAHNSLDKDEVKFIHKKLKIRGLHCWIDEEQINEKKTFQMAIQEAIPTVKSAAIFFGIKGLGEWQKEEAFALFTECKDKDKSIIPVLLPGVDDIPQDYRFLKERSFVHFVKGIKDIEALDKLESYIKGNNKPEKFFDVWFCYDMEDAQEVEKIARQLKEEGVQVWLNQWQVAAGKNEHILLDKEIRRKRIGSVAVFVGSNGASWLDESTKGELIWDLYLQKYPIIPVYLTNMLQNPLSDIPIYIRSRKHVDFFQQNAIDQLYWGITGEQL